MKTPASPEAREIVDAHAIVEESFSTLRFPIDKAEAIASVGDRPLPEGLTLGDIIRGMPAKAFSDPFQAARAADARIVTIQRALDAVRTAELRR